MAGTSDNAGVLADLASPGDTGGDAARVAALQAHNLLDTPPEPSFDALVEMCALACQVPIALVSLVDKDRQWFKAKVGIDGSMTDRCASFCSVAIETPDRLLVVEDAARDPRFADNPLVVGAPGVRFYAGAPLLDGEGVPLGTVCIIDRRPRTFTGIQRGMLVAAATQATELIRLRASERRLTELTQDLESQHDLMTHLVKVIGHDFRSPLHAIQHMSEWGIEAFTEGDYREIPDLFERIQGRASRVEGMHSGLLELLKGDLDRERCEVHLQGLVDGIADLHGDGVGLTIDFTGPETLRSVPQLLSTILSNLVVNSVKFRGSVDSVRVKVRVAPNLGRWVLDYVDDGPGIPDDALDRIFTPFERLVARDQVEGTGLGLSLLKKAARALGGDARAVPHEGGAHFVVDLGPVALADTAA